MIDVDIAVLCREQVGFVIGQEVLKRDRNCVEGFAEEREAEWMAVYALAQLTCQGKVDLFDPTGGALLEQRCALVGCESRQFQVLLAIQAEQVARGVENGGAFVGELLDELDQGNCSSILRFHGFIQRFQIIQYKQGAPPAQALQNLFFEFGLPGVFLKVYAQETGEAGCEDRECRYIFHRVCPYAAGPGMREAFCCYAGKRGFALATIGMNGDDTRAAVASKPFAQLNLLVDAPLERVLHFWQYPGDAAQRVLRLLIPHIWIAECGCISGRRLCERGIQDKITGSPGSFALCQRETGL